MSVTVSFRPATQGAFAARDIILGCAPSAGLYHKAITVTDVRDLLTLAAQRGVPSVDTAPWYGCGRSEMNIGASWSTGLAESLSLCTKAGRYIVPRVAADKDDPSVAWGDHCYRFDKDTEDTVCVHDYTYEGIMRSWEQSKQRLGPAAKSVTCLRLHDCDVPSRFDQATADKGGVTALMDLKAQGEIKQISLGMNTPSFILRLLQKYPNVFDNVLMAGAWNPFDMSGLPVFAECEKQGIPVQLAGVFGAGLMWGGPNYKYQSASEEVLERRAKMQQICEEHSVALPALAIYFATRPKGVTHLVLGCASGSELEGCLAQVDWIAEGTNIEKAAAALKQCSQMGLLPEKCDGW